MSSCHCYTDADGVTVAPVRHPEKNNLDLGTLRSLSLATVSLLGSDSLFLQNQVVDDRNYLVIFLHLSVEACGRITSPSLAGKERGMKSVKGFEVWSLVLTNDGQ